MAEKEYTWKDFDEFVLGAVGTSTTDPNCWIITKRNEVLAYFKEHPEKLLEGGTFKERGYSVEEVKKILNHEMPGPFLTL